jgi:hypothetical protein
MVSGMPSQPFREDSLVNERVNMPECRYAMFVQICMGEHGVKCNMVTVRPYIITVALQHL